MSSRTRLRGRHLHRSPLSRARPRLTCRGDPSRTPNPAHAVRVRRAPDSRCDDRDQTGSLRRLSWPTGPIRRWTRARPADVIDVFVYVVVLNLAIEYTPSVTSESFSLSLSCPGFDGDLISRILSSGREFRAMGRPSKYPQELIDRGVRLALESGRPIAHVAKDLGIGPEVLRKRVRQAQADAGEGGEVPTSQEREEVRKLRRENLELRRANEILKSASLYFARELDPDRSR